MRTRPFAPATGGSPIVFLLAALVPGPDPLQAVQTLPGSDEPRFLHEVWTVEDGLPVNHVNWLIQGRDGYLWLTTFDGLVRFDGVRFRVFGSDAPGLPTARLLKLVEGADGSLWILTESNRAVRLSDGAFSTVPTEDGIARGLVRTDDDQIWILTRLELGRIVGDSVHVELRFPERIETQKLVPSGQGGFWITARGGRLARFRNGALTWYEGRAGPAVGRIHHLWEDPHGTLWVAGDRGLRTLDPDGKEFRAFRRPDGEPWTGRTWRLVPHSGGGVLIRTDSVVWSHREGELTPFLRGAVETNTPEANLVTRDGTLWMARGPRLYREQRLVFEAPDRITRILEDREGSIWVASGGLHRLKRASVTVLGEPEGLVRNVYSVAMQRDGTLWFGTLRQGLGRLRHGRHRIFLQEHGIRSNLPFSVYVDRHDQLWVGFWRYGVCRFDGTACHSPAGPRELDAANVRAIYQDTRGDHWFGADEGLFRRGAGGWTTYTRGDGLPRQGIRVFEESRDGSLWIGTYGGGVVRFSGGAFEALTSEAGLSSDLIRSLYEDEEEILWVGTEGRGLNRVEVDPEDLSASRVTVYAGDQGLFGGVVHQILEDDDRRLWMSSNQGIFWVSKAELEAVARGDSTRVHSVSYTEREGLRNREANGGVQSPGIRDREGRLWFATMEGAAVLDPSEIHRNEVPPPVVIEAVRTSRQELSPVGREGIELTPGDRDLEIRYTGLSLLAPEKIRFRYRLEGFEPDWHLAEGRRAAFYTNVPPGNYTFRVLASNNEGVWNTEGARLDVRVAPFFYETKWFMALILLSVVGGTVLYLGWRERQARARQHELARMVRARTRELSEEKEASEHARAEADRQRAEAERHGEIARDALRTVADQAAELRELDEAKSRFFANISHEFRTPLTLTIGPLEDLRAGAHGNVDDEALESVELALRNSRRLLRLVNQILDVSKLEAGQMELRVRLENVVPLVEGLVRAFTPLAERKRIDLRFEAPGDPVRLHFDPDLLEKVFTNLVSNAFKFTPRGGTIEVTIEQAGTEDSGTVRVSVRDSGPGIPEDALERVFERFYQGRDPQGREDVGTGIGLSLARELTGLHGGRIEVESREGFGSTFAVVLPRGSDHLPEGVASTEDGGPGEGALPSPHVAEEVAELVERDPAGPEEASTTEGTRASSRADEDRTTVLVVDDSQEVRAYVREHLEDRYRVVEAADGQSGLEAVRGQLPDLVLSDVMMPGLDGHQLCRRLKEDPDTEFIPVILLTARAETEERVEGLEEGADDYLTKPFDMRELLARVENLIESRKRLKERARASAILRPSEVEVVSEDERFLQRLRTAVEERLDDPELDVETLALELGHSRSSLYRRLGEILDASPAELIKGIRLDRAAQLLEASAGSVAEVAYGVGFKSVSHFSRSFRERFGTPPSRYRGSSPGS